MYILVEMYHYNSAGQSPMYEGTIACNRTLNHKARTQHDYYYTYFEAKNSLKIATLLLNVIWCLSKMHLINSVSY